MKDGRKYSFNYFSEVRPLGSNVAHIAKTDEFGKREIVGSVDLGPGVIPYVHDFSMTGSHIVLCIWPVRIGADTMITSHRDFLRELVRSWCLSHSSLSSFSSLSFISLLACCKLISASCVFKGMAATAWNENIHIRY